MNISEDFKPVITRAAVALQTKKNAESTKFTAFVFDEPKFNSHKTNPDEKGDVKPTQSTTKPSAKGNAPEDSEFDMKKARHEVLNFAMANQRVIKNKRKMEIFQLIKMGAKPPKKVCKNYKDLQDERKRLKQIREERKKFNQLGKNQTGVASVKCRSKTKLDHSKKKRAPVSNIDQHYGKAQPKFKKRK